MSIVRLIVSTACLAICFLYLVQNWRRLNDPESTGLRFLVYTQAIRRELLRVVELWLLWLLSVLGMANPVVLSHDTVFGSLELRLAFLTAVPVLITLQATMDNIAATWVRMNFLSDSQEEVGFTEGEE